MIYASSFARAAWTRLSQIKSLTGIILSVCTTALIACCASAAPQQADWQALAAEAESNLKEQNLGAAEKCLRGALRRLEGSKHNALDMVAVQNKLADTLLLEDRADEAKMFYGRSLHVLKRSFGKDSLKLVPTLFALGALYEGEGSPNRAIPLYEHALEISKGSSGQLNLASAECLHKLGRASLSAGDKEAAAKDYKEALSIYMRRGQTDRHVESLLADFADLQSKNVAAGPTRQSDFQKEMLKDRAGLKGPLSISSAWQEQRAAEAKEFRQGQTNEEQNVILRGMKQPIENKTLAPVYATLGDALYQQNFYTLGEPSYQLMIAIDMKALGPDHPSVADDLTGLSLLYVSQHRYKEAEPLLRRALAIYRSSYGDDSLLVTRTRVCLADVVSRLGNPEKASELYARAWQQAGSTVAPDNLDTAKVLNELAFNYFCRGKLDEALTIYQWALSSTEGAVGQQDPLVAACLKDYAAVLRAAGRTSEADFMDARAKMILDKGT